MTDRLRYVAWTEWAAIAAVVAHAVVRGDPALAVNAGGALLVATAPLWIRRYYGETLETGLALWLGTSGLFHAVGSLGLYRTVGWFDQLAHTVSAALIAGLGYAAVTALDRAGRDVRFPSEFRAGFVFLFTLAFGVGWEILEFGVGRLWVLVLGGDPLLVQYGLRDVVLDLVFDAAGAVVVAVGGTDAFRGVVRLLRRRIL